MATFSKIIAFPKRALFHLVTSAPRKGNAYPRFAEAFGNRTAAPAETTNRERPAS